MRRPGGKTTHLLEIAPAAQVIAVDVDRQHAARIDDNLQRLGMQAEIGAGRTPEDWCDNRLFDRILLSDIKWSRRDVDIAELAELQRQILHAAWRILKARRHVVVCHLFNSVGEKPRSNHRFLAGHPDARLQETGDATALGLQCLPSLASGDSFFYAKMIKGTQTTNTEIITGSCAR